MKTIIIGIAVLALSACASNGIQHQTRAMLGQPAEYVQGFDDGCRSGKNLAGWDMFHPIKKDMRRYGVERLYTVGWNDGKEKCFADAKASQF